MSYCKIHMEDRESCILGQLVEVEGFGLSDVDVDGADTSAGLFDFRYILTLEGPAELVDGRIVGFGHGAGGGCGGVFVGCNLVISRTNRK
jgi:hypothetical protein